MGVPGPHGLSGRAPQPAFSMEQLQVAHSATGLAEGSSDPPLPRLRRARVFLFGFGLSFLLLVAEYLTAGKFSGWFVLVPTNPAILAAALIGHELEDLVTSRWADEAFFGTLVVETALWWWVCDALLARIRSRRARRPPEPEAHEG
jgi:hypothetical protein